jgi:nucleoside-diphosphate-sugar epimerase
MKRLLIAGFGDIAQRALPRLEARFEVVRLARRYGYDLDQPGSLALGRADALLHLAPPQAAGTEDRRTAALLEMVDAAGRPPARIVYVSTSGVYGDCAGELVDETRPLAPMTERARRRADAERQLARWCAERGAALVVLRVPGIYASDRLPLARLRGRVPALRAEDDVYTNHIHAEDLAAILARALGDDAPAGVFNACDGSRLKMGDWLDLVADHCGLPRPPRIARAEAPRCVAPATLSFMSESRRLVNRRLKEAFGIRLRFPTVLEGLKHEAAVGID